MLQPFQPRQQRLLAGAGGGQEHLRAHQLQQQPGGRRPPHLDQPVADDLGRAGQFCLAEPPCLFGHAFQPVGRGVEEPALPGSGDGREDDQVAEPVEQVGGEPAGVVPALHHPVHGAEHGRAVPGRECVHYLVQQAVVGVTEQSHRAVVGQPLGTGPGEQLVEGGQRVPHRAGPGPDHQRQHRGLVADLLGGQDLLQQLPQHGRRHQPERVVVGPRPDRRDDLLRLGGGEDELQVRRRLLHQLEEGIEALPRDHVGLVNDVDLEPAGHGRVERPLPQVSGVVDAAVRGRVDLDHVDAARPGRGQRHAGRAYPARVGGGALLTVERPRKDPGAGRLAAAPRPAEEISMVDPAVAQGLAEWIRYVLLALDLGEGGGPVFAVQRQRGRRRGPPRAGRVLVLGAGRVACHGLHPRRDGKGPPAHPTEPAYPCCLPALGELAR